MTNAFDTQAQRAEHDWTADEIVKLTRLWTEGLSGTEIGRRLGITKSSVTGKVRRLCLPGRVSPLLRLYPAHARPPFVDPEAPAVPDERAAAALLEARRRYFATLPVAKGTACQFPMWGDERPTHAFCDDACVTGRPYCAAHCAVAYATAVPAEPAQEG